MESSRKGSNPADRQKMHLDLQSSQLITYKMLAYSQFHSFQSVKKVNRIGEMMKESKKSEQNVLFFLKIYDVVDI